MAPAARSLALLLRQPCWGKRLAAAQAYSATHSFQTSGYQQQSDPAGRTHEQPLQQERREQQQAQQQAQQQQQQQQQVSTMQKQALSWQELHRAAQIAAWSGLCYVMPDELQARIQQQHAQLTLVAHGRNAFTGWFIVDGVVPHAHFCSTVRQRTAAGSRSSSNGGISDDDDDADACAVPGGRRERFIFMRGVQWSAQDVDSTKLSQALMRLWPAHFPRIQPKTRNAATSSAAATPGSSSSSNGKGTAGTAAVAAGAVPLVAHDGVAELAESMFDQLRPYFDQADDVDMPICFAGHSLGGSLAMLTMVQYQLQSRRRHSSSPSCYTFGSPPVLAHEQGGGGHRVLQALRLPSDCVKNFVLENDPVPRALLSVDPTFELLSSWGAVQGLLQLRQLLAGQGSPLSPGRFLFESVGQVHLIKWTPEGGSEVVPLDSHEIETELSFLAPKPVGVSMSKPKSQQPGELLSESYCSHLPDSSRQHCHNYFVSQGGEKFTAAADWRHYNHASYDCSGIDADCLNADLQSNAAGTVCRPLQEGTACGDKQRCMSGVCGGASSTDASTSSSKAPLPGKPTTPKPDADSAAADGPKSSTLMPAGPNTTWPTAIASVWPANTGVRIPEQFLATSHEWKRITDYTGPTFEAWAGIFKKLGPSPIIRIGGASQDAMTEVPGPETWVSLEKLQRATNCRFIIGLPLWQKNAAEMGRHIIDQAQKHLGDSLMGFELGNEPEFWPTGLGGYDEKGQWQSGFEAYAAYFHRVATALNPCSDGKPILSGPGWGNVNTQDPSWFAKVLGAGKCYLWEANTHYYPYINNETVTAPELLSQWLQDFALDKFKAYVGIAKKAGLPVRISETNSMYGGGRVGLSDTMVGAFWTIDALFAFANAGALSFHLHWGNGGQPNGDNPPSVGVQTNFILKAGQDPWPYPSVHAPWYGYLFWTLASAGGYGKAADTSFVAANVERWDKCAANIKVYALKSDGGDVRIALINKDVDKPCNVDVRVDSKFCSNKASLSRMLPGRLGIFSKGGITWHGQTYENSGFTGKLQNAVEQVAVRPQLFAGKPCSYNIGLPAASAALLVVSPDEALTE
ncbi:hypothetical protein OEZ85_006841 [Tetradesmus obliquus]|uniref:Fungal lipase-type domain-containing protein n=1 Tax=Tetradesmus obliquus TaxID=3088 RepID=A0ABY8TVS9_TETOB|nr:hypothetical protein OEZ85_006841 [Tetradesmus obliquus]